MLTINLTAWDRVPMNLVTPLAFVLVISDTTCRFSYKHYQCCQSSRKPIILSSSYTNRKLNPSYNSIRQVSFSLIICVQYPFCPTCLSWQTLGWLNGLAPTQIILTPLFDCDFLFFHFRSRFQSVPCLIVPRGS